MIQRNINEENKIEWKSSIKHNRHELSMEQ